MREKSLTAPALPLETERWLNGFFAYPSRGGKPRLIDVSVSSPDLYLGRIQLKLGLLVSEQLPLSSLTRVLYYRAFGYGLDVIISLACCTLRFSRTSSPMLRTRC